MPPAVRTVAAAAALACLPALVGCGGGPDDEGSVAASPGPDETSSASDSAAAPEPPTEAALRDRCGGLLPDASSVSAVRLTGTPPGDLVVGAEIEPGRGEASTVMVLLHQTGPLGLCGFGPFATAAAGRGTASLAVDLCGYGDSECSSDLGDDVGEQVRLAVEHARREMGARQVVLVGASMGGAEAVLAVEGGVRVDAWADLSGPNYWDVRAPLDEADPAPLRALPGLVAMTTADQPTEIEAARTLARRAGAPFVGGSGGHGWELLTDDRGRLLPVGERVLGLADA